LLGASLLYSLGGGLYVLARRVVRGPMSPAERKARESQREIDRAVRGMRRGI
jgi:hypothetical protein